MNNNNKTHTHTSTLHSSIQLTHNPISQNISCLYSRLRPGFNTVTLALTSLQMNASPQKSYFRLCVKIGAFIGYTSRSVIHSDLYLARLAVSSSRSVSNNVDLMHWLAPVQLHSATLAHLDGLQWFLNPAGMCSAELHRLTLYQQHKLSGMISCCNLEKQFVTLIGSTHIIIIRTGCS